MTRGRKKDLTIPPSRALAQQRDYRARKAQYLAQLEAHCRRVEQENVLLRQEIESLRAGLPVAASQSLNPQLVSASSDLMRDLSAASSSLERFQMLAYSQRESNPRPRPPSPSLHPPRPNLRPPSPSLQPPSPSLRPSSPSPSNSSSINSQYMPDTIPRLRPAFFPSPPCSDDQDFELREHEYEQYAWPEEASGLARPPESQSLRKILWSSSMSDVPSQGNASQSPSPENIPHPSTGSDSL
ncbi:hypothetical protein BT96DRAFT_473831 [Gymnopus androsaceus JB14]|uniref:BZIP domain-containing protein n=1 Tax=Gymnopus androsaceus JB14 TaxID=1447944 RepID=A0A6A4I1A1_9AGAR|nr:hypothetical protein BT96DRAFT_473831 [Gymnopus androsaceus JB14]